MIDLRRVVPLVGVCLNLFLMTVVARAFIHTHKPSDVAAALYIGVLVLICAEIGAKQR